MKNGQSKRKRTELEQLVIDKAALAAALRALVGYVRREGGWMRGTDQELLRRAELVLERCGS